jgi:hypothetical protein
MAGDKAEPGTGGSSNFHKYVMCSSLCRPRTHASTGLSLAQRGAVRALRQVEGPRRNSPWATMTADPPTSTVSTEVESPRARAKSTEGRPIWAP